MRKWLLVLAGSSIMLSACNSTESKDDPGLSGTYQYQITDGGDTYTNQAEFGKYGTFKARTWYPDADGVSCQQSEVTAKWTQSGDQIKLSNRKTRERTSGLCSDNFTAFSDMPDKSIQVRNVTDTSMEIYDSGDSEGPAQWVKFTKL